MAGGGKVHIIDRDSSRYDETARVVNGRLLVDTGTTSGGPTSDVNIASVGGTPVTSPLPVSITAPVTIVEPVSVDDNGGSLTVDGTVTVAAITAPVTIVEPVSVDDNGGSLTVDGTVAATQGTSPWVIGDGGGSITVDGSVAILGTVPVTVEAATGLVSTGNSTTTPLGGGATFTGTFENVKNYAGITITVLSTQNSATDGFKLQWSHNGVNVDREDTMTVLANQGRAFGVPVEGQFFRIVYTNGGTPQVTFRLGITYKPTAPGLNAVSITEDIPFSGAVVVGTRSVITGESSAGGGSFVNVKVTPSGAIVADVGIVSVNVLGTVAVTQSTSPWVVGDGGGSLTVDDGGLSITVDGSVTVTQATHANLNATVRVQDSGTGVLLDVVADTDPFSDVAGITPMFEGIDNPAGGGVTTAQFHHGFISPTSGGIWVHVADGIVGVVGVTPGTTAQALGKAEDAVHASGDVGVMALAVRADTASPTAALGDYTPLLTDSGGRLHTAVGNVVPGVTGNALGKAEDNPHLSGDTGVMSLAVRQDTLAALAANGDYIPVVVDSLGRQWTNVDVVSPGTGALNLGKAEDAVHTTGDVGVMALAVRLDSTAIPLAGTTNDYIPLTTDANGRLWCNVSRLSPGVTATDLGKQEDAAHGSGDVGVMALAVRQDTLAALAANGDYIPLTVDALGRLNTKAADVQTIPFSGSTRGRPVQVVATATAGTLIHTATTTTGSVDKIFLWLCNTSAAAVTVTFEFGTSGVANEVDVIVPANESVLAINGAVLGGAATDELRAYATTASVVNAIGRVERLS